MTAALLAAFFYSASRSANRHNAGTRAFPSTPLVSPVPDSVMQPWGYGKRSGGLRGCTAPFGLAFGRAAALDRPGLSGVMLGWFFMAEKHRRGPSGPTHRTGSPALLAGVVMASDNRHRRLLAGVLRPPSGYLTAAVVVAGVVFVRRDVS